jgi:hypothetical protein
VSSYATTFRKGIFKYSIKFSVHFRLQRVAEGEALEFIHLRGVLGLEGNSSNQANNRYSAF